MTLVYEKKKKTMKTELQICMAVLDFFLAKKERKSTLSDCILNKQDNNFEVLRGPTELRKMMVSSKS